jgi:PEP-CTERM motif
MRLKSALFALPLSLLLLAPHATFADTLTLENTDNGIFPYNFSVNGSTAPYTPMTCLNDTREVQVGETWTVTAISLLNLTGTVDHGQTTEKELDEDAFLDSKYNTGFAGATNLEIQDAIWDIQDSSDFSHLNSVEKTLVADAIAFYTANPDTNPADASFYSQFTVYIPTNTNEGGRLGEPQQFMQYIPGTPGNAPPAVTPEPSSLLLFGTGLLGTVGILRRRMLKTQTASIN